MPVWEPRSAGLANLSLQQMQGQKVWGALAVWVAELMAELTVE